MSLWSTDPGTAGWTDCGAGTRGARTTGGLRPPLAGVVGALIVLVGLAAAGPVSSTGQNTPKIAEIEKATEVFQKGQVDEAFNLLKEAVKKNPALPPARLMLARFFFASNQLAAGRSVLEAAAVETPDHPEIYLSNGSLALGENRITETLLNCQTALALAQQDRWSAEQKKQYQRDARSGLAAAYEARKDWQNAKSQLLALLELEPKSGLVRQRVARSLFFLDKPADAVAELNVAIKDEPTLEPPALTMGRLWTEKGDVKQAAEWMQKAVEREPNNMRVHLVYGQWLLDQSRPEEAKLHADLAGKLDPKSKDVEKLRGLLARYLRDYEAAEKIFDGLYREAPADFFVTNQLAHALVEQTDASKKNRAVQIAEVNARQYQKLAEALSTLGWIYYRTGRMDDAEKALAASVSGGQATADTAYYLAQVFSERGKTSEATRLVKASLESKGPFLFRKEAQALAAKLASASTEKTGATGKN